jgi:hypothetical protein
MPTAEVDYLHTCAARHRELTEKLTGKPQDHEAIERAVAGARSRRALTYDTVQAIVESPNFAAGQRFWTWPSRAEIEDGLRGQEINLWNLPKDERAVLKKLRAVFKTFEAVSVILRFLVPKHYGILSTPAEYLLGIQPAAESIDRYLNYVRDLRTIRDKRGLKTAARVDQALWTLQLGVYGGRLDEVDDLKKAHARDGFLRSIRVKNLADALFDPMSRLDLAESLIPHRLELAAQLAALEFERAVRVYAKRSSAVADLSSIIEQFAPAHAVGDWQRCRSLRNRAVHGKALDHREVEALVLAVRQIDDLEQLKRGPFVTDR